MERYLIRPAQATLADAAAILQVEHTSLGDSHYVPEEAWAVLQRPEHRAFLAFCGDEAVGFCSCLRMLEGATPTFEVDLLGVAPEHRGHGLGTALIQAALDSARAEGIVHARALVAVENHASRRAFERAGMRPEGPARNLHVYTIHGFSPVPYLPDGWRTEGLEVSPSAFAPHWVYRLYEGERLVGEVEGVLAYTLAYRGFWVEALRANSPQAPHLLLRHLVERAKALHLDEVGYLASGEEIAFSADDLIFAGFPIVGTYYRLREVPQ